MMIMISEQSLNSGYRYNKLNHTNYQQILKFKKILSPYKCKKVSLRNRFQKFVNNQVETINDASQDEEPFKMLTAKRGLYIWQVSPVPAWGASTETIYKTLLDRSLWRRAKVWMISIKTRGKVYFHVSTAARPWAAPQGCSGHAEIKPSKQTEMNAKFMNYIQVKQIPLLRFASFY